MSKQLITVALFAAISLMAASFTNAQTTQKKSELKSAGQKKSEDVEDEPLKTHTEWNLTIRPLNYSL